jgi:hypothetical protein
MNCNISLTGAVSYGTNRPRLSRRRPADYRGDRNG